MQYGSRATQLAFATQGICLGPLPNVFALLNPDGPSFSNLQCYIYHHSFQCINWDNKHISFSPVGPPIDNSCQNRTYGPSLQSIQYCFPVPNISLPEKHRYIFLKMTCT
jgi:hypothetical protein